MLKRQNVDTAFIIRLTPHVSFYMIPDGWIHDWNKTLSYQADYREKFKIKSINYLMWFNKVRISNNEHESSITRFFAQSSIVQPKNIQVIWE